MPLLYLDEESDYSEESIYMWYWNLSLHHCAIISVWAWTENTCGNENHKKGKKLNKFTLQLPVYYILE